MLARAQQAAAANTPRHGTSKGALYNLTMRLARILARDRIRVNWISVGWVLTEKEIEVQAKEGHNLVG